MASSHAVLDPTQLRRIQAVHRGFLYQHLFAVGTLLLAGLSSLEALHLERDEDIEVSLPDRRIYAQVKTRSSALQPSDLEDTIKRFDQVRRAHDDGERPLIAEFWIVTNVEPSESLKEAIKAWPHDVHFRSPNYEFGETASLPPAWKDLAEAIEWCTRQAESVPFASLDPETLVWKLAGMVLFSCTGEVQRDLTAAELPSILEQLVVQLHRFPSLPTRYRPHEDEPDFDSHVKIRLIVGFSGVGKTTWAASGSLHSGALVTYFDVGDAPSSAVAPSLARELAATVLLGRPEEIKRLMLPGASGLQSLRGIDLYVQRNKVSLTIVLDNAHRMNLEELVQIIRIGPSSHWVLLAQPWPERTALATALGIDSQSLLGWSLREIAEEFATFGCQLSPPQAERVRRLTGGLPLFVQSSAKMVSDYYSKDAEKFCREIENATHSHTTGQEAILTQVQRRLSKVAAQVSSLLSISNIPLAVSDAKFFIAGSLGLSEVEVSATIRELEGWGVLESLRDGRIAMHDAFRPLAQLGQSSLKSEVVVSAKKLLVEKLKGRHGIPAFRLLCRLLPDIGEMETLVDIASDASEYFQELGMSKEFESVLLDAVNADTVSPSDKFWALDTMIFWKLQAEKDEEVGRYLKEAEKVCDSLGSPVRQKQALELKRLILAGRRRNLRVAKEIFASAVSLSPQDALFERIVKYNYAAVLCANEKYQDAADITFPLVQEYFDVLGLQLEDVVAKNPPEIFAKLRDDFDPGDLKHLADCLDVHARVMDGLNITSPLARLHAFKFYAMANALNSAMKVGMDVVDQLLTMGDKNGARHFVESTMLRVFSEGQALDYFIPVHSQYAVLLAYCGEFDAARRTMAELSPFLEAAPEWRPECKNQERLIELIATGAEALPPEIERPKYLERRSRSKVGRNEPCPCGSGKKYKKCCGQ